MMPGSYTWMIIKRSRRFGINIVVLIVLVIFVLMHSMCQMTSDNTTSISERAVRYHQRRKMNGDLNIRYFERLPGHDYGYIHNPRNICMSDDGQHEASILLLFLVLTTPGQTERREAIRATHGNETHWPIIDEGEVRTVFLVGEINDYVIQDYIDGEMYYYGDIVQSTEFVDDYKNRTRKIKMGLRWVKDHCHHALYVMKIEDHAMINQRTLLQRLRTNRKLKNFILGDVVTDKNNLDDIPREFLRNVPREFYSLPTLHPYLNGASYILSSDLVQAIHKVSQRVPTIFTADVYVGLCLQRIGVKLTENNNVSFSKIVGYDNFEQSVIEIFDKSFALSYLSVRQMYFMWRLGQISCL